MIAAVAVAGTVAVAVATGGATAPASGQKVFDAPGCLPVSYDGPGRRPHYLLGRDCPTPTPVIVTAVSRRGGARRVVLDGSRSFDPMGGRLTEFSWALGPGPQRKGRRIVVTGWRAGPHPVVLYVSNDTGLTGTLAEVVTVP